MRISRETWRAAAAIGLPTMALGLGTSGGGCLPSDSRPTPGSAVLRIESSDATRAGFVTSDGWTLRFGRVLGAVGDVELHDSSDPSGGTSTCNDYSDSRYDRLFDFTKVTAPQRVAIVYGLGACALGFRLRSPSADGLIEIGATQADVDVMRTEATDAYAEDQRVNLWVKGQAEKDGTITTFDWSFRQGADVSLCPTPDGSGYVNTFQLVAHDERSLDAIFAIEELFRADDDDAAPFEFARMAGADGDGDGAITVGELGAVELPAPASGAGGTHDIGPPPKTLADLVYQRLVPRVVRFVGGAACKSRRRD